MRRSPLLPRLDPSVGGPSGPFRRRPATLAAVLLTAAALLAAPATATAATAPDQWTGTFGDAGNASANPGERAVTAAQASRIRTAWTKNDSQSGRYPPVVLGGVTYTVGGATSARFLASSPRTGATLWTLALPGAASDYGYGTAGTGHTVVVSFRGDPGGVLAVDTTTRRIVWRSTLPPATIAGDGNDYPGLPATDGARVYLSGASNAINAYSLASGALLWKVPLTFGSNGGLNGVQGIGVGSGYVYTGSSTGGGAGLIAYSAATGKQAWKSSTAAAYGRPVVTGGRVFVSTGSGVAAYTAAGCGRATCAATWTTAVDSTDVGGPTVAAADGAGVFVTFRTRASAGAACGSAFLGNVTRLSAGTGTVQWHVALGDYTAGLVRGGDTIWLFDEYWNAAAGCVQQNRILGFSATATSSARLASIPLPSRYSGFPQTLAVASGTLFESTLALVGYRIPAG